MYCPWRRDIRRFVVRVYIVVGKQQRRVGLSRSGAAARKPVAHLTACERARCLERVRERRRWRAAAAATVRAAAVRAPHLDGPVEARAVSRHSVLGDPAHDHRVRTACERELQLLGSTRGGRLRDVNRAAAASLLSTHQRRGRRCGHRCKHDGKQRPCTHACASTSLTTATTASWLERVDTWNTSASTVSSASQPAP